MLDIFSQENCFLTVGNLKSISNELKILSKIIPKHPPKAQAKAKFNTNHNETVKSLFYVATKSCVFYLAVRQLETLRHLSIFITCLLVRLHLVTELRLLPHIMPKVLHTIHHFATRFFFRELCQIGRAHV